MSEEKIYVGNGKKITTQYGDLMKLSLTAEDLEKMQANLSNGWINLNVKERREPSAGGMTHYLEVDTWKPSGGNSEEAPKAAKPAPAQEDLQPEDLPF
ncbi:hypothetical protein GW756_00545 [bacterium]|nr:hypothetical protein [bacterium]NCQ54847.1 hypothetical protein [Candidatus Parcubacteria bacterium]NCS66891.1 hypothetical protein [Candidatus Peregrinibacteria bacterium]NCS95837.1 hypothetical protein [bacterium]